MATNTSEGTHQQLGVRKHSERLVWYKRAGTLSFAGRALVFLVAFVGSVAFLLPFAWAVSTSLKTPAQIFVFPPEWIPNPPQWQNYPDAFKVLPFGQFFINTTVITVISMIGDVLINVLVAYGFARIRFAGREALFIMVIATMMLPMQVTLIPVYMIFSRLGWIDTFYPLTVPSFFGNPFFIFLLRQFFMTIPFDLEDSASIDGAGRFRILVSIMAPLSGPAIATVAVMSFMNHWQDFFAPLLYLNSREKLTISLGLRMFESEYAGWDWHHLMAMTIVTTIPSLLLFFFAQRYFISGIVMTGIKG